jgi:RNA polymerase sigma-70 factor (ECF subfamily)
MLPLVEPDLDIGSALDGADDAILVDRAREGDLRAFTVLLRRHNQTLRRYIQRLTRNFADTDDVLQDTAINAWRHLDSIQDPARVRAWLIQIATREALRAVTARPAHHELAEDTAVVDGPEQQTDRLDVREALQRVLDALPQQQARCWILRELGGYSYAEIAEQLQLPESTVRGSLVQARKNILTRMGGDR